MNGIVVNIDPVLVHLGGLSLRWYGLAVVAAIWVAVLVAAREAPRKGITKDAIYSVALWGVTGGVLGSRLFHVIDKFGYYSAHPAAILSLQQGGLAIWGGVVGGILAGAVYAKLRRIPLAPLADVAILGLLAGQIVGRIGCIVNGDAYGGPTDLPWGFIYTNPGSMIPDSLRGVPTHPYPAYEMLWNLASLSLLWLLRTRLKTQGLLFFSYVFLYSLGRFWLTFVRQEDAWFWGLQEAQIVAAIGFAGSILGLAYLRIHSRPTPQPGVARSGGTAGASARSGRSGRRPRAS